MESFYGGRQGVSFVIVKRFDGVDIPQNGEKVYQTDYFACDKRGQLIIENDTLVRRNANNYNDTQYTAWKRCPLDGSQYGSAVFPLELAYGMVQCFEQGGITTNEVNYGEYVIIDTPDVNNPDNGKIYRRGLDYQKSEDNPLAGAEYIGQVVGPQGETPELSLGDYQHNPIDGSLNHHIGSYNPNDGLVPGANVTYSNGKVNVTDFQDNIKYSWITLKDEFENISGCEIGFEFPYHVFAMTADSVDAYYNRSNSGTDFINQNLLTRVDDASHPYFSQWKVAVPKGIKGDAQTNLHVTSSVAEKGSRCYTDTAGLKATNPAVYLSEDTEIDLEAYATHTDDRTKPVKVNGQLYYIKAENVSQDILVYKTTNYDRVAEGDTECIKLGSYNMIEKITLDGNGVLTAFYTHDAPMRLEETLRWIHIIQDEYGNIVDNGIQLAEDGTLSITYNTNHINQNGAIEYDKQSYGQAIKWINKNKNSISMDEEGNVKVIYNTTHTDSQGNIVNDFDDFTHAITWIKDISLKQTGEFQVLYNNDSKNTYNQLLKWVDNCEILDDGTIIFYYNQRDENGNPINKAFHREKFIKFIKDIYVDWDNKNSQNPQEGTGDQKIHVKFNTEEEIEIGAPLNYIMETVVSKALLNDKDNSVITEANHLLVLYSDPEYRNQLKAAGKCVSYYSEKFGGELRDDWYDMGYVRGEPGTVRFIGNLETADLLIPGNSPEVLTGNPAYAGYCYTVGQADDDNKIIYYYDYTGGPLNNENKPIGEWIKLGSIASSLSNPTSIITIGENTEELPQLNNGGYLFVTEATLFAE